MKLDLEWSVAAKREFLYLVEQIEEDWGEKAVKRFLNRTDKVLAMIQTYPGMFPRQEGHRNVRKCVLHPNTTLYYSYGYLQLNVLALWDNRRDPQYLKRRLG